jgi:hypothetical protein
MTLCAGDASPTHLYQAALAIFFGMFFDAFDGRVARLTKTQSLFGQELDSLADVISFGAAPALLVWKWALAGLGLPGLLGLAHADFPSFWPSSSLFRLEGGLAPPERLRCCLDWRLGCCLGFGRSCSSTSSNRSVNRDSGLQIQVAAFEAGNL